VFVLLLACAPAPTTPGAAPWSCTIPDGDDPEYAESLGCRADFDAMASAPADASIPGAVSVKTILDRVDGDRLYFQDSQRYCVHWEFCSEHLSGGDLPRVPELSQFNATEYSSPDRRFVLGALTYYAGPDRYVYEISPYDTAGAAMIETAYRAIAAHTWIGANLGFHPSGAAVEAVASSLPGDVPIVSTDFLYAGIDYQPLNLGTATGILRFRSADEVDAGYTNYREVVVLDAVPNDISVVAGIITAEFQAPLAHINVLSVNRGTPNMAYAGALGDDELRALDGKWVELEVGANAWSVREVTEAEAESWWEEHKPAPLVVQPLDTTVTDLRPVIDVLDLERDDLRAAISAAIPAFGAKATHYGALAEAAAQGLPIPVQDGFVVPMYYYDQFMQDHDLWAIAAAMEQSSEWSDPAARAVLLEEFKDTMRALPMRAEVVSRITEKARAVFPGESARFRSSTNAEDLGAFTGAGLYDSETGDPAIAGDGEDSVEWAVKRAWSQAWNPRAYEERAYYSIVHRDVGMALLVHANFPEEEANGVALTNNPFDTSGLEPAFYVNAQAGSTDVVSPDPGTMPDAYLHYYYSAGSPIVYSQHSTEVAVGETVLTPAESQRLGEALDAVSAFFRPVYGDGNAWYAMDVEWKFDDKYTPGTPALFVKQARPFPGWETAELECAGE
jgi:hypothetical protein